MHDIMVYILSFKYLRQHNFQEKVPKKVLKVFPAVVTNEHQAKQLTTPTMF